MTETLRRPCITPVILIDLVNCICYPEGMNALRRYLDDRGMQQKDLAAAVGVSRPVISMWVAGARRPNLRNATELERVTGIPASTWIAPKRRARKAG